MPEPVNVFQTFAVEKRSPFDIEKLSDKFRRHNTGWTIPEAYLCVLLAASAADGTFNSAETGAIQEIVRRSRAMAALSAHDLAAANNTVNTRLQNNPLALQEACQTLPTDMGLPVFAHAIDIILADGELLGREADFLNQLASLLELESDQARRVMEVMLLRAQY